MDFCAPAGLGGADTKEPDVPRNKSIDRLLPIAALGAGLALTGCTVGPDFKAPSVWSPTSWFTSHNEKPPAKDESHPVPEPLDAAWWSEFHDPELSSLEQRVAASNLDLRTAGFRLAESRSQRSIATADQFPSINGNASYTREKASNRGVFSALGGSDTSANGAGQGTVANGAGSSLGAGGVQTSTVNGIPPFDLFQYGFDASWEVDLWGRVRRSVESANASVQASAEDRRNVLLSVLAEVARDYIQLRGTQREIEITQDNLRTDQQALNLANDRYKGGLGTELDVANAASQVAAATAQLPQLEQQEAQAINRLSYLIGETPGALRNELVAHKPIPPVPPVVPIGFPSELARRRPDIRQAEAQLHAATADIGVAVASFYPSVTLSGSLGIQALQFKDLATWDARQYALGPSLTIPIFQGGRLKAQLELRKQQQQEAAVNYERTVLQAWHDVDNAMIAYQDEQRRRDQLATAVQANQRALTLARDQYTSGVTDFLNVLDAERSLLTAQQQYAQSTTNVSTDLVALYKALGGGWESTYPRLEADASGTNRPL
jgi:NodT family efflux transporter outer membrane factor (OMF) lipoprotein